MVGLGHMCSSVSTRLVVESFTKTEEIVPLKLPSQAATDGCGAITAAEIGVSPKHGVSAPICFAFGVTKYSEDEVRSERGIIADW